MLLFLKHFSFTVLGEFLRPNRRIDPVRVVDVTVGRPLQLSCPPSTYTHPREFLWGDVPPPNQGRPVVLPAIRRRYVLSNGNLFYAFVEDSDLTYINNQLKGVSCLLYIAGRYRASVKTSLSKVGGMLIFGNFFSVKMVPAVKGLFGSKPERHFDVNITYKTVWTSIDLVLHRFDLFH